jgi:long-chain acyl-CoA synthetase
MQVRIWKDKPEAKLGEIQVKGENVMSGYYKNTEATKESFTEDGWLRTGDLGTVDAYGNIFLRGRIKTMILSANGQNIFPEEIESVLNNMPFIHESLVIERDKKLVALVNPDIEQLEALDLNHPDILKTIMDENLKNLNSQIAAYEKVNQIQLYPTEFIRTPTRKIKRYLYNNIASDQNSISIKE